MNKRKSKLDGYVVKKNKKMERDGMRRDKRQGETWMMYPPHT